MAEMSGAEIIGAGELSRTRNIHLPKNGRALPREAEVGQPGPYYPQPRAGADAGTTRIPMFLCLFIQSLTAVWQLWLQILGLSVLSPHQFGCFPKMAFQAMLVSGRWQRAGRSGSKSLRAAKCLPL